MGRLVFKKLMYVIIITNAKNIPFLYGIVFLLERLSTQQPPNQLTTNQIATTHKSKNYYCFRFISYNVEFHS